MKDAMKLSQEVQSIQHRLPAAWDKDCYRPGDVSFMGARLEQLAARLPLQSQLVNVPFENTSGGFELFNVGTTDLAPELIGWYGGPGIVPDGPTSLFLVGDNFSVHQTRVIAGGVVLSAELPALPTRELPNTNPSKGQVELLSRQVMRITIPGGCQPKNGKIDVHVATPYGVSHNVAIPVVGATPQPSSTSVGGYAIDEKASPIKVSYDLSSSDGGKTFTPQVHSLGSQKIEIKWEEPTEVL